MVKPPIVSVTGTKGKTTTVAIIADVLRRLDKNVLKVDTTGHFVNGERHSTLEDSTEVWGLVPSVAPGRFLYEFFLDPALSQNGVAVLECSLGSSTLSGMGYALHNVGVFLNVYEDHLGSTGRLKTREDILLAKQFIFQRLRRGGYAVFNADDALVVKGLRAVPDYFSVSLLPFGREYAHFDAQKHLRAGGKLVTIEDGNIIYKGSGESIIIASLADLPWTFNGEFMPSVYNAMAAVAAVIGLHDGVVPEGLGGALRSVRFDPYHGRLTFLKSTRNVTILADYAHEKVSLREVARLARNVAGPDHKVIGVVRLAYDRTDKLIRETGAYIAKDFDAFVVYDKIDGYWKQAKTDLHSKIFREQVVGRVSEIFAEALAAQNTHVERILREDEALTRAAEIAQPGDVVVFIVNDNIKRSIDFVKEKFDAELV